MTLLIPILIAVVVFGFVVVLVIRNQLDKEKLEDKLNNDYPKPKDVETDL